MALISLEIDVYFIVYRSCNVAPTLVAFQQTPVHIMACVIRYSYWMTMLSPPIFTLAMIVQTC